MDYSRMTKQELITLLTLREKPVTCNNPQTAFDYLRPYASTEQENFVLLMLDGAHNVKNVKLITKGLINRTLVHPREVFSVAIENRATAVILSHCHPKRTLQYTVDLLNASSFRSAILSLCDYSLTERLCLISLIETHLRKINVNLRQISRRLSSSGEKDDVILSACEMLNSLIDLFSSEITCLRFSDSDADSERKELAVRMTSDEKDVVVSVKRALKFRNFRTLVLSLCGIVNNQILPPDFSHEYQVLREHGSNINTVAKALNSGTAINIEQFNKYITGFMLFLCDVARKAEGI